MKMAAPRVARNSKGIYVQGLDDLIRGLKVAMAGSATALTASHRRVAAFLLKQAKPSAPGFTKDSMRAEGTNTAAKITVNYAHPASIGTFMGAKQRFGWYGAERYAGSSGRQFQPWVGNQWVPGEQSGKPYYIGEPLNEATDEAVEMYADEILKLVRLAFPIKT